MGFGRSFSAFTELFLALSEVPGKTAVLELCGAWSFVVLLAALANYFWRLLKSAENGPIRSPRGTRFRALGGQHTSTRFARATGRFTIDHNINVY